MGKNLAEISSSDRTLFSYSKKKCVFISHKKEDEAVAVEIGKYLTEIADVNIYLDLHDCILQEAVSEEKKKKIVESIHKALEISTHLLCIVSDKTKTSWWVPYEIGYATKKEINIASLQLKNVEDIPSYLKIKKVLKTTDEFIQHISKINYYGEALFDLKYKELNEKDKSIVIKYMR